MHTPNLLHRSLALSAQAILLTLLLSVPATARAEQILRGGKAVIPADSANGIPLGPVRRGERVSLQYLAGTWKSWAGQPTENPDAEITERGNASRVVIALPSGGASSGQVIALVPANSQVRPFVFEPAVDYSNVILRINDMDGTYSDNPGKVEYAVRISRAEVAPSTAAPLPAIAKPSPTPRPRPAPRNDPIVGRWNLRKTILEVSSTGSFVNTAPGYHETGRWRKAGGGYEFDWSDGRRKEVFTLRGDELKKYRQNDGWHTQGSRIR